MKKAIPILLLLTTVLLGCNQKTSCPAIEPFYAQDFIAVYRPFGKQKRYPVMCSRPVFKNGIVYEVEKNAPVRSIHSGKIIKIWHRKSGEGNYLIIDHGNQRIAKYHHLDTIKVAEGQFVEQGKIIAISGNSGLTTVNSIGLMILDKQRYINPALVLNCVEE